MSEGSDENKRIRGVQGWKAFLLMFGCGTTSALVVVGLLVGLINLIVSGSSGQDSQSDGVQASRKPRESMSPGKLDLCAVMEEDALSTEVYPERLDAEEKPPDSATFSPSPKSGYRTVKDDCSWSITPDGLSKWELNLAYVGYIESVDGSSVKSKAKSELKSIQDKVEGEIDSPDVSDGKSTWGEQSKSFYGEGSGKEDPVYSVVAREKGVVFNIRMKVLDTDSKPNSSEFEEQADNAAKAVREEVHYVTPD